MKGQFGVISKAILQDKELHAIAKAVYCYLSCFADRRGVAYPSRALMCRDLGITKDTLTKYLKQLTERGYVRVEKNKRQGRFSNNVYFLPCHKISDTVSSDAVFSDTILSDTMERSLSLPVPNSTKETVPSLNNTSGREPPAREKPTKHKFGEYHHVMLTDEEHKKLIDDLGDSATAKYIRRVDVYCEKHNKSYPNCAATIRDWYEQDKSEPADKGGYDSGAGYTDIYAILGGKEK